MDREPTEQEKAYVAGIIDGEGCLFLARSRNYRRDGSFSWNYCAQVTVGVVDRVITDWLLDRFGGKVTTCGKSKPAHWRHVYRWQAWSGSAGRFLQQIKPYLVLKKDRAILLLAHRALVGRHGPAVLYRASPPGNQGGAVQRPDALTAVHDRIHFEIKRRNQRLAA